MHCTMLDANSPRLFLLGIRSQRTAASAPTALSQLLYYADSRSFYQPPGVRLIPQNMTASIGILTTSSVLRALVVVVFDSLGLSGTATFLAGGLLRFGFVVAVLDVVSRLKWRNMSGKKNKD